MAVLRFHGVSFSYRRSTLSIINGLTWTVPPGRTVLLGPNGAGKSTLLGLGASLYRPQTGEVTIDGARHSRRAHGEAPQLRVGLMPQSIRPVPALSTRAQVAYAGWLCGMRKAEAWNATPRVLDLVGLGAESEKKSTELSGGQLRRLGLAETLIGDPKIILLDEPTVGLDPAQRARFRAVLAALPRETPVVISTHQVDDLNEICDTVIVLLNGAIAFSGPLDIFLRKGSGSGVQRVENAYRMVLESTAA